MENELNDFLKKTLLGILIFIILLIPTIFFFKNRFMNNETEVLKRINNKDTFFALVYDDNTSIKEIDSYLKEKNIKYVKLNKSRDTNYQNILIKLEVSRDDILVPAILLIE